LSINNLQQFVMNLKEHHRTLLDILGNNFKTNYLII
jgi:hypothetical protein